jgi:succinoglycan biosynthesis protein ExoA
MNAEAPRPTASIVVPCRNEQRHVAACIGSILRQIPPAGGLEVLVVDGRSTDGTRDLLERMAAQTSTLRIIDNPEGLTPTAMNRGIREASGRYVAIFGAHAEYAPDYVRTCVEFLETHPDVCCAGGPITSRGHTRFGKAVAVAMSHPLGVGNAKHRFPDYDGYAEAVCFPVIRRTIFDTVGLFDEALVRNQDDEFYYRVALAGEKTFLLRRARCTYFVRDTPAALFRQYFQYGFWRLAVVKKHRAPASIRQLIPAAFVVMLCASLVACLVVPGWWRWAGAAVPMTYGFALTVMAISVGWRRGAMIGALVPVATAILHLSYGIGFLWGVCTGHGTDAESVGSTKPVRGGQVSREIR